VERGRREEGDGMSDGILFGIRCPPGVVVDHSRGCQQRIPRTTTSFNTSDHRRRGEGKEGGRGCDERGPATEKRGEKRGGLGPSPLLEKRGEERGEIYKKGGSIPTKNTVTEPI